jgi:L-ascorbate metabolism protein UlaG (beta-lactamase superfamily)
MVTHQKENPSSVASPSIHYLGHASFLIRFPNGKTLLTDYGKSNAYDLDSPIHDLGEMQPDIVTYSHHHDDHDRGQAFPEAITLMGESMAVEDIQFQAVPMTEREPGDNFGYLITHQGVSILHAGDCQGNMVAEDQEQAFEELQAQLPARLDLLLWPIGWYRGIIPQAADFLRRMHPSRAIPMHYWSEEEKRNFLDHLRNSGDDTLIREEEGAQFDCIPRTTEEGIEVISLHAAPFK